MAQVCGSCALSAFPQDLSLRLKSGSLLGYSVHGEHENTLKWGAEIWSILGVGIEQDNARKIVRHVSRARMQTVPRKMLAPQILSPLWVATPQLVFWGILKRDPHL